MIHTAYIHDFSRIDDAARTELSAVESLGAALDGSGRPFVVTTATALVGRGRVATEEDFGAPGAGHPRLGTERIAHELAERGVRTAVVRPGASVHGKGDRHFVATLVEIARRRGVSAYIGDGSNRWPAVHRLDAARLYRLVLEAAPAGSTYHAVADEGVPVREIAEAIGRSLELPVVAIDAEQAAEHFGWMATFFSADIPASSRLTQERLGWRPEQPGLIEDLEQGHYFEEARASLV